MTIEGLSLEPWVDLGGPDRRDRGWYVGRCTSSNEVTARCASGQAVHHRRGWPCRGGLPDRALTYTPSVPTRQISCTSANYEDKVDTFTVDVVDDHGTRAEVHVVVDILATELVSETVSRPSLRHGCGRADVGPAPATIFTASHVVDMVVRGHPADRLRRGGNPKRPTSSVTGAVISRNTGVLGCGPVLFTTAEGGLVSVGALSGQFSYTPSDQARLLAMSGADLDDEATPSPSPSPICTARSTEVPVTVEILAADMPPVGTPILRLPDTNDVVAGHIQGTARDGGTLVQSLAKPTQSRRIHR